eukprot:1817916-Pyramimonas_sp.AAC.1
METSGKPEANFETVKEHRAPPQRKGFLLQRPDCTGAPAPPGLLDSRSSPTRDPAATPQRLSALRSGRAVAPRAQAGRGGAEFARVTGEMEGGG